MRAALSDWQVDVLKWIATGCPEGVMSGHSYKTTALALRGRRLVIVSKRGGVWRVTVTTMGDYYLEHGDYPPESLSGAGRPGGAGTGRTRREPLPATHTRTEHPPDGEPRAVFPRPKRLPPTEQLVADLGEPRPQSSLRAREGIKARLINYDDTRAGRSR